MIDLPIITDDDIGYGKRPKLTGVISLSARGRVEAGPVEDQCMLAGNWGNSGDCCCKGALVGIGIVKTFGHSRSGFLCCYTGVEMSTGLWDRSKTSGAHCARSINEKLP